jgi:methyl-accepting chemotaxis protein
MMDITCDACSKRYRIDETRMKSATAKVRCKACGNMIHVAKPQTIHLAETIFDGGTPPPATPPPPELPAAAGGDNDSAAALPIPGPATFESALEPTETPALAPPQKVRFGLFGKTLLMLLLISLLPFGVFWFLTFGETSDRIRNDSEALMAQTAKGLGDQVDAWINANLSVLRTMAKLPEIVSMSREQQEAALKAVHREYPWMYLVFTVAPNGMNVARNDGQPLVSYADRQYVKDILAGKAVGWQTVIGRTSKVPALVIAVPIKEDNRIVGVMAAAMTVEEMSKQVATWKKGGTGFAFLVDDKGFVLSHPKKQLVEKRENLSTHPLITEFRKKGWTTMTTAFTAENGQSTLGHARRSNYGWVLALMQEEQEVFEALAIIQNFALALLAATVLLAAACAWFSARALATPIMKLTDAAERMSLGDLNVKIDVQSRDEIGLLAQAIGRMQTSLRMAMERLRKKK